MSQEQEPMQDPDTPGAVPVEAEASSPAKPRARRPRAASPVVEPAPAGAEEALKPARKTTRRRKADDVVPAEAEVAATVAAEATAVDEAAVAEVVPKPAARSRRKAPAVVADAPLATAAEAATQDVVVAAADAGQSSDLADQKPVAAEASADANVEANADDHADVMAEPEPGVGPRRAAMAAQQAEEMVQVLLTGDFDREQEAEVVQESEAYKRVLRPEPDAPKLQKVLAQSGVGSRRDIEKMIEDGRIEVNDLVAHIGHRVSFGDRIKLAGKIRIISAEGRFSGVVLGALPFILGGTLTLLNPKYMDSLWGTPEGLRFRLGTGFTDAQRERPPAVGEWVTYRFRGLNASGTPRFASFLRVRPDVLR